MGKAEDWQSKADSALASSKWEDARKSYSEALKAELDTQGGLQIRPEFVAQLYHGRGVCKYEMGCKLPFTEKCEPPKWECPKEDLLEDAIVDAMCAYNADKSQGKYVYMKAKSLMEMKRFREAEKVIKKAQKLGYEEATDAKIKECEEKYPEEDEHYKIPDHIKVHKLDWPKEWENQRLVHGIVQEVGDDVKDEVLEDGTVKRAPRVGDRVSAWVDRDQIYQADD